VKFKEGDKVRVLADSFYTRRSKLYRVGKTGVVVGTTYTDIWPYRVKFSDGEVVSYKPTELELVGESTSKTVLYVLVWQENDDHYETFGSREELDAQIEKFVLDDVDRHSAAVFEVKAHYKIITPKSFKYQTISGEGSLGRAVKKQPVKRHFKIRGRPAKKAA